MNVMSITPEIGFFGGGDIRLNAAAWTSALMAQNEKSQEEIKSELKIIKEIDSPEKYRMHIRGLRDKYSSDLATVQDNPASTMEDRVQAGVRANMPDEKLIVEAKQSHYQKIEALTKQIKDNKDAIGKIQSQQEACKNKLNSFPDTAEGLRASIEARKSIPECQVNVLFKTQEAEQVQTAKRKSFSM